MCHGEFIASSTQLKKVLLVQTWLVAFPAQYLRSYVRFLQLIKSVLVLGTYVNVNMVSPSTSVLSCCFSNKCQDELSCFLLSCIWVFHVLLKVHVSGYAEGKRVGRYVKGSPNQTSFVFSSLSGKCVFGACSWLDSCWVARERERRAAH